MPDTGASSIRSGSTPWTWATWVFLGVLWIGLGEILIRMPFQVSDLVGNLVALRNVSLWSLVWSHIDSGAYFRPLLWGFFKIVFDASGGHYFVAYKIVEIAQLGLLLALFGRVLNVRSREDFLLMTFAAAVLIGHHAFGGFLWENYPINAYLTIAIFVLAAVNISESPWAGRNDVAAVVLLVVAMLMVESGLLVWVALMTAYLAGARGVSRRGMAIASFAFVAYFAFRFAVLPGGTPGLDERSTGFGFAVLDPEVLQQRFGDNPLPFYLSNIASALSSLLLSEPRYGVWEFTRALVTEEHDVRPWMVINVTATLVTTSIVLAYSLRRALRWMRLDVRREERLVVVFWGLAIANAVFSYAYNKDQIISVAAILYPLAVFIATRALVASLSTRRRMVQFAVILALAVASAAWGVRTIGLRYVLHAAAYRHANDWVQVGIWLDAQHFAEKDPGAEAFVLRLQDDMIRMEVPPPSFVYGRWGERIFDQHP